jgi:arylsulfatase/uncharacterized sulfatase
MIRVFKVAVVALSVSALSLLSAMAQSSEAQEPATDVEATETAAADAAPSKFVQPNFVVILFDDAGYTDFGAYGSDSRTPNIDALAARGITLARFYASPFCGPTRAMLMTGMDNHQVGMGTLVETTTDEMRALPGYSMTWEDDQETIATLLSDANYQTYVTGKWGIGEVGGNLPNRFGFDRSFVMDATGGGNYDAKPYLPGSHGVEWFEDGKPVTLPEGWYSSRSLVDKMIEYIDEGKSDEPFYAFLSLQALHMPIQVSADYTDRYDGVFDAGWDVMREERLKRTIALGLVPPTTTLAPPPASHRAWDELSPDQQRVSAREMQVNAGMMESADFHIGRLIDYLEQEGLLENTIIIIASDNGPESAMTSFEGPLNLALDAVKLIEGFDTSYENLGLPNSLTAIGPEWASVSAAPFNLYKFYASEGGLRVPLVIAGPGIADSGVELAPVHVADLVPTLLDAADVDYDEAAFYGRSVLPMLSGQTDNTRGDDDSFAFEVSGNAALYRGKWKITRNARPMGDSEWRLYDLSIDPGETTDLAAQNPELFADMLAEYEAYAEEVGVFELGPDEYALKVLNEKLVNNMIGKYWPHATGFVFAVLLVLLLLFKLVPGLLRRAHA